MIEKVKIQGDGYIAVENGIEWSGITEESRFYPLIQKWIAEGNTPEPEFTQTELDQRSIDEANAIELALLAELDRKSIRDIREYIANQPDSPQTLKDREAQAVSARGRLR